MLYSVTVSRVSDTQISFRLVMLHFPPRSDDFYNYRINVCPRANKNKMQVNFPGPRPMNMILILSELCLLSSSTYFGKTVIDNFFRCCII